MRKTLICLAFLFPFLFACGETPTEPKAIDPPVAYSESQEFTIMGIWDYTYGSGGQIMGMASGEISSYGGVWMEIQDPRGNSPMIDCFAQGYTFNCMFQFREYPCTFAEQQLGSTIQLMYFVMLTNADMYDMQTASQNGVINYTCQPLVIT
jgi:hypothetical protein